MHSLFFFPSSLCRPQIDNGLSNRVHLKQKLTGYAERKKLKIKQVEVYIRQPEYCTTQDLVVSSMDLPQICAESFFPINSNHFAPHI